MKNFKHLLLFILFATLGGSVFAQTSSDEEGRDEKKYDKRYATDPLTYDSVFIPRKRMEQHTDFLNRKYPFPGKPRNWWEIGLNGGLFSVSGDVHWKPYYGFGVSLRKAFGYTFALRGDFIYGVAKGQNYERSSGIDQNPALNGTWYPGSDTTTSDYYTPNYNSTLGYVYHNYRTDIRELSLNGILTLNNIKFHKRRNCVELYGLFGVGGMIYSTYYDQLDANGRQYHYEKIALMQDDTSDVTNIGGRKDILAALKDMQDGKYETAAERHFDENSLKLGDKIYTFNPEFNTGIGIAFKLGRRFNLAFEEKVAWVNDDLLDGQRWQEWGGEGTRALTREFDSYNYTSARLNINLGSKKAVEPLWWLNPLDYGYNELMQRQVLPEVKPFQLLDADDDGVPDDFDREPNTPAGCPVDNHGVTLDTDGDGVPDCKDKELITPTYCQPADKDGIGKCPCCDNGPVVKDCPSVSESICFDLNKTNIKSESNAKLDAIAAKLKDSPNCKMVVYGGPGNKYKQQINWSRAQKVVDYMTERHGLSRDRFCIQYSGESGDAGKSCIGIRTATGSEPCVSNPAPPHPALGSGKD